MKWIKNLFRRRNAKIKNEFTGKNERLPLIIRWEFDSGDIIYGYERKYYGLICSRYWKFLNVSFNNLKAYGESENVAKHSILKIKELFLNVVKGIDVVESATTGISITENMLTYVGNKTAIEFEQLKLIICTFNVLNGEQMGIVDEQINAKKLSLIMNNDEARDFFFQDARQICRSLDLSLEKDIPDLTVLMMDQLVKKHSTP